jgi:O-antigen/teichoic acid export membrane protein
VIKLKKHGFFVTVARFFEAFIALLNNILVARMLGPDGRGKYALILTIIMFLQVPATLGVTDSNVYLLSKDKYSINNFITNSILFSIISSVFFIMLFFALYQLFIHQIVPTLTIQEVFYPLWVLPIAVLFVYLQNILVGLGSINRFIKTNILLCTSQLLFVLFFIIDFTLTVNEAIYAYLLSYVMVCVYSLWCCIREAGAFNFKPNMELARESFNYGFKSNIGTILQTARDRFEVILVGYFLTNTAVGYYSIAQGITDRLKLLPKTISYLLFAEIANLEGKQGEELAVNVTRNLLFIMSVIVFPIILFSRYIILLLYGRDFLPTQVPLCILFVSTIFSGVVFSLGSLRLGQGRPERYSYATGIALLVTIGLDGILIPYWGIIGAAIGNIMGVLAMVLFYMLDNFSEIKFRDIFIIQRADLQSFLTLGRKILEASIYKIKMSFQ